MVFQYNMYKLYWLFTVQIEIHIGLTCRYPNNLHCTWRIIALPGEIVRITIEELDLAQNDTIIIYDGNSINLTS